MKLQGERDFYFLKFVPRGRCCVHRCLWGAQSFCGDKSSWCSFTDELLVHFRCLLYLTLLISLMFSFLTLKLLFLFLVEGWSAITQEELLISYTNIRTLYCPDAWVLALCSVKVVSVVLCELPSPFSNILLLVYVVTVQDELKTININDTFWEIVPP